MSQSASMRRRLNALLAIDEDAITFSTKSYKPPEKTAAKNLRIAGVASPAAKPGTPRQSSSSAGFQTVLGYDDTISLTIAHPDRYIDLIHKYPLIIILDDSNYNYLWGSLIE
ncbi:hypothetical protein C8J57DRAFT_1724991 [Mycena rebaudengoi]|nr:hypothetical protein C8J57DRAFT_1724991 [Mycena rebaudengoi]